MTEPTVSDVADLRSCATLFAGRRLDVLYALSRRAMRAGELGELLGLEPPAVTHAVAQLMRLGLVERERSHRNAAWSLTDMCSCKENGKDVCMSVHMPDGTNISVRVNNPHGDLRGRADQRVQESRQDPEPQSSSKTSEERMGNLGSTVMRSCGILTM